MQHNLGVRIAVVPGPGGSGFLRGLGDDDTPAGEPALATDLAAAVAEHERAGAVRWVWLATQSLYPDLLRAGVRVMRCHDIGLTAALLAARDGAGGRVAQLRGAGEPVSSAAAAASRGRR